MSKRGQASLEYLLLSLATMALLFFSVSALSGIKASAEAAIFTIRFGDSASMLQRAALGVCSAGYDNERVVRLSFPISVESRAAEGGWIAVYEAAGRRMVERSPCEIEGAEASGEVTVKNEGGIIRVR